jgi:hypothetical protein
VQFEKSESYQGFASAMPAKSIRSETASAAGLGPHSR